MIKVAERKYPVLWAVKGRIRELGTTYDEVAKKMAIDTNTLGNKLNGYTDIKANEIEQLVTILNIDPNDIIKFFFPSMLRSVS